MSGNSLVLTKVMRHNSGQYRCVAANAEGEGESDDINLRILCKSYCKHLFLTFFRHKEFEKWNEHFGYSLIEYSSDATF